MKQIKKKGSIVFLTGLIIAVVCFTWSSMSFCEEKAASKQLVFGMACRDASAPFSRAIIYAAKKKAEELGVRLIVTDSKDDVLKELEQIDNFIAMGVDGYINNSASDTTAIIPGIKACNKAGIPVTAVDSCPEGGKIRFWFMNDNITASRRATEVLIDELKKRHGGKVPKGVVIEIAGALGDCFSQDIGKGFHDVIDKYPQLKCVMGEGKWDNQVTFERVSDLLVRWGDEVVAIYVYTPDVMGTGAVNAVESADYDPKKFVMTGVCMGPEGLALIKEGKYLAITAQPCLTMGRLAVQYLYDIVKGNPVPKIGDVVTEEGGISFPAKVVKNPHADGAFVQLKGPLVPIEVSADDPRLWENQVDKIMK
jgi:ribose transport system substrate-binding protein